MTRIGIDINGVLRDTNLKFEQLYQKYLIDSNDDDNIKYELAFSGSPEEISGITKTQKEDEFSYEIISDVDTNDLMNHFKFPNSEELYSFMYEEYTMELFGHAPSAELNTFNLLNDFYYNNRENFDIKIVSSEIGKSKPASLFFLSKFGCLIESVLFYSEITKNNMWDSIDILLTANPDLLLNIPEGKVVIKYNTKYNKKINSNLEISTLSDLDEKLKITKQDV